MAGAFELERGGVVKVIGGDAGIESGGFESDGGGAAADEVVVLNQKAGGGAAGANRAVGEITETAGGDFNAGGVQQLDGAARVGLEEATIDAQGGRGFRTFGGGRLWCSAAGGGRGLGRRSLGADIDQRGVGKSRALGGEGDFGDFQAVGGTFDADEWERFGGIGDGAEEGVLGVQSGEADLGGVAEEEGLIDAMGAGREDDFAAAGLDGVIDEFLDFGAGEAFRVGQGGTQQEEEGEEAAHGGAEGKGLGRGGEGLQGLGCEGAVGEGETGVRADAFDGGSRPGGVIGDGEGNGEVVAGLVAQNFFGDDGFGGLLGGAVEFDFLGDEAFGVDPEEDTSRCRF